MALAIDPAFADNRRFYTCRGGTRRAGHDVRVMVWKLNAAADPGDVTSAPAPGLPCDQGRHGGCRLLIPDNGALLVGTGDAAAGTNPQNPTSLGGKTLRSTGDRRAVAGNPFVAPPTQRQR